MTLYQLQAVNARTCLMDTSFQGSFKMPRRRYFVLIITMLVGYGLDERKVGDRVPVE
jgi:hypothetical protein